MNCKFATLRVVMATLFLIFSCLPVQAQTSNAAAAEDDLVAATGDDLAMAVTARPANGIWKVGMTKRSHARSIQAVIDNPNLQDGDTIKVSGGTFTGATLNTDKKVTIEGTKVGNRFATTIKNPRGAKTGFLFPGNGKGSGVAIKNMKFQTGLDFPVLSKGADNVTVDGNAMTKPVQGITNLNGSEWKITNNKIHDLETVYSKHGGGMGIFLGTSGTGHADNNTITNNNIWGIMKVNQKDSGYMGCVIGMATGVTPADVMPVGDASEINQINDILASADEALATVADNATDNITGNVIDNNTISVRTQHGSRDKIDVYGIGMYELAPPVTPGLPDCSISNNIIGAGNTINVASPYELAEGTSGLMSGCDNTNLTDHTPWLTDYPMKPLQ